MSKPFEHRHPYAPFLFKGMRKLIVGTLPPPRFSTGALLPGDVNFCYGSRDGLLWPILDRIFSLNLAFETTEAAILERQRFLVKRGIGICDIVAKADREKVDASDLGMKNIELRPLLEVLKTYPSVEWLIFTGGASKNGPEYFCRRLLSKNGLKLECLSSEVPRIHQFRLPISGTKTNLRKKTGAEKSNGREDRLIKTVSLTAPSGSANRAIGSMAFYKEAKIRNPNYNTLDFRIEQYRPFF